jgi:cell cycle sensor histidine kinase DivJ
VSFLVAFRNYVESLVHPSVSHDALIAARHATFIGVRILCALLALAVFPLYLVASGVPTVLDALLFGYFLLVLASAYFLSITAWLEGACLAAALLLAGMIATVAGATGGAGSVAIALLCLVPLEAVLSGSRRLIGLATGLALLVLAALVLFQSMKWLPAASEPGPTYFATVSATVALTYATLIVLGTDHFFRKGAGLLDFEESRYRLLASQMTDVIACHRKNGTVLFMSPAAEVMFATRAADLLGHGLFDRIHVADRPAYLSAVNAAAAGEKAFSAEFRVRRDSAGSPKSAAHFVWIDMRCQALDKGARIPAAEVVSVMRDVSERRARQRALEDARGDAERANATKTRALAILSHELRTPLNAIIGFSEILLNEKDIQVAAARRHDYVRMINESGHHLLSVVNEILDMSKIETGNFEIMPEPVWPQPVIVGCCDLLAVKAREAGVDIVSRVTALPEIFADKRALKQIVLNLVSNAVKFTDRGGRVVVSAIADARDVAITVEDTGIGMGETDLKRVGDPFYQARASYSRRYAGTGLGLSIVKGLVALHGGKLEICSRLGEGTRVTVRLPIDRAKSSESSKLVAFPQHDGGPHGAEEQVRKRA